MRRNIFLFALAMVLSAGMSSVFTSCKEKSAKEKLDLPEAPLITHEDTVRAFTMAGEFMEALKNNQIDSALSMLVYYPNDTVIQLPAEIRGRLKKQYELFPVKDYNIETSYFEDQLNAQVTYKYRFMDPPANDPNYPVTMNVTLQVKYYEGDYYLSLYEHSVISRGSKTEMERHVEDEMEKAKEKWAKDKEEE